MMKNVKTFWALTRVLVRRRFTRGRKSGNKLIVNQIINALKF